LSKSGIYARAKKFAAQTRNTLQKVPLLEIAGQSRVLLENHLGVLGYSPNEIQVKVSFGRIKVDGDKMELIQMNREQLVIKGMIYSVQLIRS